MDVFHLDPVTYLPDTLIEGYSSMIWTERYIGNGEFKLTTSKIYPTLDLLVEGQLISLLDSPEIMIVDTRSIGVDDEGNSELTVVGRSFETFLENRTQIATEYNVPWRVHKQYTISEMSALMFWNNFVNSTAEDPTKPSGLNDSQYAVPNVVVTDSTNFAQTRQDWWLEQGPVYPAFKDFLIIGTIGARSIRPYKTTGNVMTFNTSRTAARGDVTKTSTINITQLRLDIYNGLDRTRYQMDRPSVIFHYDSGHIDNPSYLFSTKDYKNMATIAASFGSAVVFNDGDAGRTGLDRRDLFIDGGDAGDQDLGVFLDSLLQKGKAELRKYNRLRMFDGEISPVSPYAYAKDYFLGDFVTLLAGYGFEQTMMVNEYTRTEDSEGDRGYPGLTSMLG